MSVFLPCRHPLRRGLEKRPAAKMGLETVREARILEFYEKSKRVKNLVDYCLLLTVMGAIWRHEAWLHARGTG